MTFDFLEFAKARRTTFEFSDKEVPTSVIPKILDAAVWAPSCVNSQPWHFVVVKNQKKVKAVMETGNYGFFHGTNPSVIIAAVLLKDKCAGPNHACFRGKKSGTYDNHISVGMSVLNMWYEAEQLGIDSAIITPKQKEIKSLLKVKKEDTVPLFICFGYEKKGAFKRKRERIPWEKVSSYEYFGGKK